MCARLWCERSQDQIHERKKKGFTGCQKVNEVKLALVVVRETTVSSIVGSDPDWNKWTEI